MVYILEILLAQCIRLKIVYKLLWGDGLMKNDIEKILDALSDSEAISPCDELSQIIEEQSPSELSEADLDEVVAAAKPDYEKFLARLNASK